MQEVLTRLVDVVAANPGAALGLGSTLLGILLVWGVVSSSYRYR